MSVLQITPKAEEFDPTEQKSHKSIQGVTCYRLRGFELKIPYVCNV